MHRNEVHLFFQIQEDMCSITCLSMSYRNPDSCNSLAIFSSSRSLRLLNKESQYRILAYNIQIDRCVPTKGSIPQLPWLHAQRQSIEITYITTILKMAFYKDLYLLHRSQMIRHSLVLLDFANNFCRLHSFRKIDQIPIPFQDVRITILNKCQVRKINTWGKKLKLQSQITLPI